MDLSALGETGFAWIFFGVYLVLVSLAAFVGIKKMSGFASFSVGSRNVSPVFVGMSLAANLTSAATFIINPGYHQPRISSTPDIINPGLIYLYGVSGVLGYAVAMPLGVFVGLIVFSKAFRTVGDEVTATPTPTCISRAKNSRINSTRNTTSNRATASASWPKTASSTYSCSWPPKRPDSYSCHSTTGSPPPKCNIWWTTARPPYCFFGDAQAETARTLDHSFDGRPLHDVSALIDDTPAPIQRPDASPTLDDPLIILYTSGTTGRPKGAIISHGMLFWNAVNTEMRLDLTSADRSFNAAPFYHTGGWNVLLTPFLLHGATTHLYPDFDADTILSDCDAEAYTILWGVPTMIKLISDSAVFDEVTLDTIRYAIVGGEAMPEPLIRTWQAKGVPIRQGFGMTEVGVNCFSLPARDALRKIGSIGFPNFYIDTKVVDDAGAEVPPNTTGELLMRGPVVTPGYWRDEDATTRAIDADDWFHTGDLVWVDDDGYFFVVGRKKEMYISGGENVYPAEIEAVLHEHEGVEEAAVVGVPDDQWGEVGAAFVSGTQLDAEALRTHCETHLARYKVPKYIELRDALPKGHSGKIQKTDLREQFSAAAE